MGGQRNLEYKEKENWATCEGGAVFPPQQINQYFFI